MNALAVGPTLIEHRRVFASWSIDVPTWFEEIFVRRDSYWHAWDEDRSISLSSVILSDEHDRSPTAVEILTTMTADAIAPDGDPIAELPPGLPGWAVIVPTQPPARAGRALHGTLALDGRVLLVTITSDDAEWRSRIWRSIRGHPDAEPVLATQADPNREMRRALRHGRRRIRGR